MIQTWTPDTNTPQPDGGVYYHEVKAWFRRCRSLAEAVNIQRNKVQSQRDSATRVTQNFSGMPMTSSNGDKILDAVCRVDSEARELDRMETKLAQYRLEAINRTFCIVYAEDGHSLLTADVMRAYYIECETKDVHEQFKLKTYTDVACELGVSASTVSSCLKTGLEALAEIWPDISKTCV